MQERREGRQVWWSEPARQDLEEISRYLYQVAPRDSAERLVRALLQAGDDLSLRALLWPISMDVSIYVRSVLVRPYRLFYRVSESEVEIARILHGNQNIEAILRTLAQQRKRI